MHNQLLKKNQLHKNVREYLSPLTIHKGIYKFSKEHSETTRKKAMPVSQFPITLNKL